MPKMKTHSASKKRFRFTATGKVKRSHSYTRHHAWAKTAGQRRKLRKGAYVHDSNRAAFEVLLPYA